jgi:membrane fusion protein (multidrug efflux system)
MQAVEALEGERAANGNAQPVHWFAAMAHRRVRRVALGLAFALLLLLALWWLRFRPFVATDDARVAAPVIVVAPEGNGGRVERVLVKEGQQVEAGQALVELDAAEERVRVERAKALLAVADAKVEEAEAQLALDRRLADASQRRALAGVRSAEAARDRTVRGARIEDIARARAQVGEASVLADQAKRDRGRAEVLAKGGAIPAAGLDAARTAAASAGEALAAHQAALALLERGSRPEDVAISQGAVLQAKAEAIEAGAGEDRVLLRTRQLDAARAQAAQARAELALAEVALGRMTLKSTSAGAVVRVPIEPGDHLAPGQGALTIVDVAHAWIAANVEETSSGLLRPGQPAHVDVDEGGELEARVEAVIPSAASQFALIPADNAAGNFTKVVQRIPVRLTILPSARNPALRVGQSVEVRIRVR